APGRHDGVDLRRQHEDLDAVLAEFGQAEAVGAITGDRFAAVLQDQHSIVGEDAVEIEYDEINPSGPAATCVFIPRQPRNIDRELFLLQRPFGQFEVGQAVDV